MDNTVLAALLADEEGMLLREVMRYVLSLGMYLSAYPAALRSRITFRYIGTGNHWIQNTRAAR